MAEPTIDELLKLSFKLAADAERFLEPHLEWPDDFDGQRSIIRRLVGLATTTVPGLPHHWRVWAFDKLLEIARDYADMHPELILWGYGVGTGKIKRPKRPRKRPSLDMDFRKTEDIPRTIKHRLIVRFVSWLQEQGHAKTPMAAIERVANAAELTPGRVREILEESSKE